MSAEYPRLAMSSALTYQMIYEQPVCWEFADIKAKTLLVIGQADRTVVGKGRVKKELLSMVGQYPELGRKMVKLIAGATLVEIPECRPHTPSGGYGTVQPGVADLYKPINYEAVPLNLPYCLCLHLAIDYFVLRSDSRPWAGSIRRMNARLKISADLNLYD